MVAPLAVEEERMVSLTMGPALLEELEGLAQFRGRYDTIIINCTTEEFLFPAELLVKAATNAGELLTVKGCTVFVKSDQILTFVKESSYGDLSLHTFDSIAQLYDFSASLAMKVQSSTGAPSEPVVRSSNLCDQILMSTVPVLSETGISAKVNLGSNAKQNAVLRAIDNYSSITTIGIHLSTVSNMNLDDLKDELKSLERQKLIYPIFTKVPFIAERFRNQVPITMEEYLVGSGLISEDQLEQLLIKRPGEDRDLQLGIGPRSVLQGYYSSRQLEIVLHDLALYGGSSQRQGTTLPTTAADHLTQSLVGHLGATDPSGLLQNLATNRENGLLAVESHNQEFRCVYSNGTPTYAKLGNILGEDALTEFVSSWDEGIFVFMHREPRPDLVVEACKLKRPLDKLLLTAALVRDNQDVVWKKLPHGIQSILEKRPDTDSVLQKSDLQDPLDPRQLTPRELDVMRRLWQVSDGFITVAQTIHNLVDATTTEVSQAVDRLMQLDLLGIPKSNFTLALSNFRQLVHSVAQHVDLQQNNALLRLGLQSALGYSLVARIFTISPQGEIGFNLGAAHGAGLSVSEIVCYLEDWQVKYVECLCRQMDITLLKDIVYSIYTPSEMSYMSVRSKFPTG